MRGTRDDLEKLFACALFYRPAPAKSFQRPIDFGGVQLASKTR